ncbi:MAG: hypothetical protein A2511_00730 [Deltaproteobacteria bacterium RIFOXYD12_FULL_50_9]|nr:MAG: hypothetical protein A2511_00730 [Deltaproteobacteria bacterium RIFOXYD12_FULL_50_9]
MITNGNRHTRWYQHKTQGGNCMTSLKYRLPSVAMLAINQLRNKIVQPKVDVCTVLLIIIILQGKQYFDI